MKTTRIFATWIALQNSGRVLRPILRILFPFGSYRRRIPDWCLRKSNNLVTHIERAFRRGALRVTNEEWPRDLPLLSVVIPCFNYGRYIKEAIDSVMSQTFLDYEIIIVDGGSTDNGTTALLHRLKNSVIKVFFRTERHLPGDNRNYGIERAQGKYICCLDPDDFLMPTYFEKALYILETYRHDVVYPSVQCFGERNETW